MARRGVVGLGVVADQVSVERGKDGAFFVVVHGDQGSRSVLSRHSTKRLADEYATEQRQGIREREARYTTQAACCNPRSRAVSRFGLKVGGPAVGLLRVVFSPVNRGYFLMWGEAVLRVFNSAADALAEGDRLIEGTSLDPGKRGRNPGKAPADPSVVMQREAAGSLSGFRGARLYKPAMLAAAAKQAAARVRGRLKYWRLVVQDDAVFVAARVQVPGAARPDWYTEIL